MKKSIWGYNISETDTLVDSLQNQNDLMTTEISSLSMNLNSVKADLADRIEEAKNLKKSEELVTQLNLKVATLEKENETLKRDKDIRLNALTVENETLTKKLLKLESAIPERSNDRNPQGYAIGAICERAYLDMEKMRKDTSEEVKNKIDDYVDIVDDSNGKMRSALSEIQTRYAEMVENVSNSFQKVLDTLGSIDTYRQQIEENILPIQNISSDLKEKIDTLVDTSIENSSLTFGTEEDRETEISDSEIYKGFDLFHHVPDDRDNEEIHFFPNHNFEPHKIEPSGKYDSQKQDPVIGIHTNINPKKIFGA